MVEVEAAKHMPAWSMFQKGTFLLIDLEIIGFTIGRSAISMIGHTLSHRNRQRVISVQCCSDDQVAVILIVLKFCNAYCLT